MYHKKYCINKNAIYLGEQLLTLVNAFVKMVPFCANASVLGLLILSFPYTPSCMPASSAGIRIEFFILIIKMNHLVKLFKLNNFLFDQIPIPNIITVFFASAPQTTTDNTMKM